ncbi:Fic family protein [Luteolibacter yonseiensis]
MNSYYSNLIEGHKTLPRDIERAMRDDFSPLPDDQRNQLLSVAHIKAERSMRNRLAAEKDLNPFDPDFISWLHHEFYSHIPESDWFTTSHEGIRHSLNPGAMRDHNVDVGRHTPPDHASLPLFMRRFHSCYSSSELPATDALIAVAAAHHRLAWIHPFGDGNGRVGRLQTQAAMIRIGLDGEGLWTLSRGLARTRSTYYTRLQNADQGRHNDYDGRGNLSDRGLSEFCIYFLEQILDQLDFMIGLIEPFHLRQRIENYFRFNRVDLEPRFRDPLIKLVTELILKGEIPRGAVPGILGLKGTASREVIRKALDEGLAYSTTEKGPLRIAFPSKVAEYYFPLLFSDLPVGGS